MLDEFIQEFAEDFTLPLISSLAIDLLMGWSANSRASWWPVDLIPGSWTVEACVKSGILRAGPTKEQRG